MSRLFEKLSENLTAREVARPDPLSPEFSLDQRRTLLRIAREAILYVLERENPNHRKHWGTQGMAPPPFPEAPPSAGLSEPRGVFTTLYLKGDLHNDLHRELRGCVGYALPIAPLYRAVACSPACPRFIPRQWKSGATACSSRMALDAACCCPRSQSKMVGTGKLFLSKPAARLACRWMPGARAQPSRRSRPRSSATLMSKLSAEFPGTVWSVSGFPPRVYPRDILPALGTRRLWA